MTDFILDTNTTTIDTAMFSYTTPKAHASGAKVVNLIDSRSKRSLEIKLPMLLTWGAQEGKNLDTGVPTGKYSMSLQYPSDDYATADATLSLASMKIIESAIRDGALVNSKQWFGKDWYNVPDDERKFNKRLIDEKFNSMLKYPKKVKGGTELDLERAPTITVKLPQWSGVWKSEIYDANGEQLFVSGKTDPDVSPLDFLPSKTRVMCLLQCGGIWLGNGKASITWNLKQAMVQSQEKIVEGTCFLTASSADKEAFNLVDNTIEQPVENIPSKVNDTTATLVDDTDDESDDGDEEEEDNEDATYQPETVVEPEPVVEPVVEPEPEPVVESEPEPVGEPAPVIVKPKKKIVRKATTTAAA